MGRLRTASYLPSQTLATRSNEEDSIPARRSTSACGSYLGCAAVAAAQRSFDIALEVQGRLLAGEVQVAFPCALDAVERRVLADGQVGVGAEDMRVAR